MVTRVTERSIPRSALAAFAVSSGVGVALGIAPLNAVLLGLLCAGVTWAVRRSHRDAVARRTRTALPAIAEGLAAAARAGLPLVDGLAVVALSQPAPLREALCEAAALMRLGAPLDRAFAGVDDLVGPSALLLRETLRMFYRRGGNLGRALDRAAALARAELQVQDETRALTAQGRASSLVLVLLAPCGLLFYAAANPGGMSSFLADARGQNLLSVALLLEGVGALWLWRLVRR